MKILEQPKGGDYSTFFSTYLNLLSGNNYEEQMLQQADAMVSLFHIKGMKWADTPYAEGKWTPKEVLGHVIDTERIMTFRALCFARGEKSALPGFDQDEYVSNANFGGVSLHHLLDDLMAQRIALLSMIRTIPEDCLDLVGMANGYPITPRALFWIILGHFSHHFTILQDRY